MMTKPRSSLARVCAAFALAATLAVAAGCAPSSAGDGATGPGAPTAAPVPPPTAGGPTASPPADGPAAAPSKEVPLSTTPDPAASAKTELATFAGGCYWCIEAVFEQIPGVLDAKSGFMGGDERRISYREVCEGDTGHAEVVQLTFDPAKVSFEKLVEVFWDAHDPTTLNRQGADFGTQYRSAIFYHSDEQRRVAEASKAKLAATLADPVVTEIVAAAKWHDAPEYHQDYYVNNREQGYCRAVIRPKLKKLGLKE